MGVDCARFAVVPRPTVSRGETFNQTSRDDVLAKRFNFFGSSLGTAYQIVDDILEFLEVVEGKESKFTSETLPHVYMKSMSKEDAVKKSTDAVKLHVNAAKETLITFKSCPARDKLFQITDYITIDMLESII